MAADSPEMEPEAHCAFTLAPDEHEFLTDEAYADLLEPVDGESTAAGGTASSVWRCRRKTNPGRRGCPFHHHLNEDADRPNDEALTRAFLAAIRGDLGTDGWIEEELNEREDGCVLEIVPREADSHGGTRRRRKQFLGARFGALTIRYEEFDTGDRYPIDLRAASADRIDWSHAKVPCPVIATDLSAAGLRLDSTWVDGRVTIGHRQQSDFSRSGVSVSMDGAVVHGDLTVTRLGSPGFHDDKDRSLRKADFSFVDIEIDGDAGFEYVSADGDISLQGATIDGGVRFWDAALGGNVSLLHATVGEEVSFRDADIAGCLSLRDITVADYVTLRGASVGGYVRFVASTVNSGIDINEAILHAGVSFRESDVDGGIDFQGTAVAETADLRSASVAGAIDCRLLRVGSDLTAANADIGRAHLGDQAELNCADTTVLGRLELVDTTVHGRVSLVQRSQGRGDGPLGPGIHGPVDLCGFDGSLTFDESCLSHPGVRAVPARRARLPTVDVVHPSPEDAASAPVVYDFEEATIGEFSLGTTAAPERSNPHVTGAPRGPPVFDRVRFLETAFDGFQFSKYRDQFARVDWNLHEPRRQGLRDIAAVGRVDDAEEIARDWLDGILATGGASATAQLDALASIGHDRYRQAIATTAESAAGDMGLDALLSTTTEWTADDDSAPDPRDRPDERVRDALLRYCLTTDGRVSRPLALDHAASMAVARLRTAIDAADGGGSSTGSGGSADRLFRDDSADETPLAASGVESRLVARVIERLTDWHDAEQREGSSAGPDSDRSLPPHTVSPAVAERVAVELDLTAEGRAVLEAAWVPIGQVWTFMSPERTPAVEETSPSPRVTLVRRHAGVGTTSDGQSPAEWAATLLARTTAAAMRAIADPEPSDLDAIEATYAMAKTAAADAGANSAASQFFRREKDAAREQHRQGLRRELRRYDGWAPLSTMLDKIGSGEPPPPAPGKDGAAGVSPAPDSTARSAERSDATTSESTPRPRPSEPDRSNAQSIRRYRNAWLGNSALRWLTGYGERPVRPIKLSGLVVLVFFAVYALSFSALEARQTSEELLGILFGNLLPAAVLSLGSFVTLLPTAPFLSGSTAICGVAAADQLTVIGCQALQFIAEFEGFLGVFLVAVFVFTLTRSVQR